MKNLSKKQIGIGVLVIIAVVWFIFSKGGKVADTQNIAVVTRGNVIQEVSVTGRVNAAKTVNIGFEKSARINGVYVKVGQHIDQGALLAEVESSLEQANLIEAEAQLTELRNGARPEELAVKQSELDGDKQSLSNAYGSVNDTVNDAFNKADDALHNKMTGIFSGYKTSNYEFTFSICDSVLSSRITTLRKSVELDFDSWRIDQNSFPLSPSTADLENELSRTLQHLEITKTFLELLNQSLTLDCTVSNTALDAYRTNVNLARVNVTAALSSVNTKIQAISSLKFTVQTVNSQLTLMKAGQTAEAITAQEARVSAAKAALNKSRIYAPISGTITTVDANVGEFATVGKPLISIITDNSFEMEASVPEADIAKIKTGDTAKITLDAYGSDVIFDGVVTTIDPAETIINNVPTYNVTFNFTKNDARIRSGMTANIDVSTASRTNVLKIPARALVTRDSQKYVAVLNADGTTTETPVTIGLRGSDGSVELVNGISEGTRIVIAITL